MDLKVTRKKIGDQVYEGLLTMILNGELPQGTRVDYAEMAEVFCASRLPLREAVQRLCSDGLMEIKPNGGTYVIELKEDEINYLFSLRRMIAKHAIMNRFDKISRSKMRELKAIFHEEEALLKNNEEISNTDRLASSDLLLHREIVMGSSDNRVISHFINLIFNYTKLAQRMNVRTSSSNIEHLRIIDAILDNDKQGTAEAVETHLNNVEQSILEGLRNKLDT
jgi:DNA-binding GntR family transcriptional regulator